MPAERGTGADSDVESHVFPAVFFHGHPTLCSPYTTNFILNYIGTVLTYPNGITATCFAVRPTTSKGDNHLRTTPVQTQIVGKIH